MRRCYHIGSLSQLKDLRNFDIVQFTASGHIFPSKRRIAGALLGITDYFNCRVIVHMDFVWIASRFALLTNPVKTAIAEELAEIINNVTNHELPVDGIVMHTDFPIQQKVWNNVSLLDTRYKSACYDLSAIRKFVEKREESYLFDCSFKELYAEVKSRLTKTPIVKICLENSTKILNGCDNPTNTVPGLLSYLESNSYMKDLFGIAIDTEHDAAITKEVLRDPPEGVTVLYHLNAIPSEAPIGKGIDRHSSTTVFECSERKFEEYDTFSKMLDSKNIPWVREIHEDAYLRELKQIDGVCQIL